VRVSPPTLHSMIATSVVRACSKVNYLARHTRPLHFSGRFCLCRGPSILVLHTIIIAKSNGVMKFIIATKFGIPLTAPTACKITYKIRSVLCWIIASTGFLCC